MRYAFAAEVAIRRELGLVPCGAGVLLAFKVRLPWLQGEKGFRGAAESKVWGSFDFAMPSLREGMAALRMTDCFCRAQLSCRAQERLEMDTVFITGGTGYMGRQLIPELLSRRL